ncbi:hypothetical protein PG995_003032 [Apiospora arundinis]
MKGETITIGAPIFPSQSIGFLKGTILPDFFRFYPFPPASGCLLTLLASPNESAILALEGLALRVVVAGVGWCLVTHRNEYFVSEVGVKFGFGS